MDFVIPGPLLKTRASVKVAPPLAVQVVAGRPVSVRFSKSISLVFLRISALVSIADNHVAEKDNSNHYEHYLNLPYVHHDKLIVVRKEKSNPHHDRNGDQGGARVDQKESREGESYGATHKEGGGANIKKMSRHKNGKDRPLVKVLTDEVEAFRGEMSSEPFLAKKGGACEPANSIY